MQPIQLSTVKLDNVNGTNYPYKRSGTMLATITVNSSATANPCSLKICGGSRMIIDPNGGDTT